MGTFTIGFSIFGLIVFKVFCFKFVGCARELTHYHLLIKDCVFYIWKNVFRKGDIVHGDKLSHCVKKIIY